MSFLAPARRVVARHPLAAFLLIGNGVYVAIALTPPFRETEIWFDLSLFASLGTIFGVGVAAFLVTAAAEGSAGVDDLLRRCLRWRVPARWYAIAVLVVPAATTLSRRRSAGQVLPGAVAQPLRLFLIVTSVVVSSAGAVIVGTRGRFAHGRDDVMRPAATPT